ncbi:MAG TPA: cytochrome D1 domain-containing protein [Steroidobacteraceae bacterium]
MTCIPARAAALRGSLAASLAVIAWLTLPTSACAARAYVSNEDDGTVTVVDTQRLAAIATIAVGKRPRGLALSRDGASLYVAVSGVPKCPPPISDKACAKLPRDRKADGVAVVDTATLKQTRLLKGVSDPERIEIGADGHTLFVTNEDTARLTVLDAARGKALGSIAVGREPEGVRTSPDGRWLLVTSVGGNSVAIIDARTRALLHTVLVGERPRDLAFTLDSSAAYVSGEADASVYRISLPSGEPTTQLLQLRKEARPMGVVFDAPRERLYVSTGHGGTVAVISLQDGRLIEEVPVGARPWGLALSADGRRLVTANGSSGDVSVVDAETLKVIGKVPAGHGPWGVVAGP